MVWESRDRRLGWGFVVVGVRVFMHGTSHWYPRRSTGLSYLLAQMWGRRRSMKRLQNCQQPNIRNKTIKQTNQSHRYHRVNRQTSCHLLLPNLFNFQFEFSSICTSSLPFSWCWMNEGSNHFLTSRSTKSPFQLSHLYFSYLLLPKLSPAIFLLIS